MISESGVQCGEVVCLSMSLVYCEVVMITESGVQCGEVVCLSMSLLYCEVV